uniref:Uncharacterized protein n=1 Tax=Rhizophora mucronata TaxID=61149 RepID=A0A2P2K1R3_RHIMU
MLPATSYLLPALTDKKITLVRICRDCFYLHQPGIQSFLPINTAEVKSCMHILVDAEKDRLTIDMEVGLRILLMCRPEKRQKKNTHTKKGNS